MRGHLLLVLLAVLFGSSRALVDLWQAECTKVCGPVTYPGYAQPNCTEPVCEIVCEASDAEEACDDIEETVEKCRVRCNTQACFDETPPCEIQCKRPPECDEDKNCSIVCEEPLCNWILLPGPPAEPECNITCEAVTCDSSGSAPTTSSGSLLSLFF